MRIAVPTDRDTVSAHFGRCPGYTLVDVEDGSVKNREMVDNPGHEPGRIPRFLKEQGVNVIIAGGMGHRAATLFEELGIDRILGVTGSVDSVIGLFLENKLEGGESLCRPHSGKDYGLDKTECDHDDQEDGERHK
jgi:predicted Fe-Mo cluster-binding NifX family protein